MAMIEPYKYYFSDYCGYNHQWLHLPAYGVLEHNYDLRYMVLVLGYIQNYQFYGWEKSKLNNEEHLNLVMPLLLNEKESFEIDDEVLTIHTDDFKEDAIQYVFHLLEIKITDIEKIDDKIKIKLSYD